MRKYFDTVVSTTTGRPLVGAQVRIRDSADDLASLYSDTGGTSLDNPVTTDSNGLYQFYIEEGTYTFEFLYGGELLQTITDVEIFEDAVDADIAAAVALAESYASAAQTAAMRVGSGGSSVSAATQARARDLLESYDAGVAIDATTDLTNAGFVTKTDPTTFTETSIDAAIPALTWPVIEVVDAEGDLRNTVLGEVPWDYSHGHRTLKLNSASAFAFAYAGVKTFAIKGKFAAGSATGVNLAVVNDTGGSSEVLCTIALENADVATANFKVSVRDTAAVTAATTYTTRIGQLRDVADDGVSFVVAVTADADGIWYSVNGCPPFYEKRITTVPTVSTISLITDANATLYLEQLIALPETVTANALVRLLDAPSLHPYILDTLVIAGESSEAGADRNRMPDGVVLGSHDGTTRILGYTCERDSSGVHAEQPFRLTEQYIQTDGVTLASDTARSVASLTPAGWATGTGQMAAPITVAITEGTYKGWLVQIFETLVNASGLIDDGTQDQDIQARLWNPATKTWGAAWTILDASAISKYALTGAGDGVYIPSDSDVAPGRVVFPIYYSPSGVTLIYSDTPTTQGGAWSLSNTVTVGGVTVTETALALRPDHTIVGITRTETQDVKRLLTSADGGGTLVDGGALAITSTNCAGSLAQTDPAGDLGPYGRLVFACCDNITLTREGILLTFFEDEAMTPVDPTYVLPRGGGYSYSKIRYIGDNKALIFVENNSFSFNDDSSCHVVLIELPARGVRV